ncbi:DUF6236 family protein [Kitasatospora sp. NPDC127059]|uniref:DUF6236 family protein n=1 Tax=unclassified Kitasatospora TaxID=2633591 RepID=UPI003653491E
MHEIGLYYPYFHVRDDAWLKLAALYLPQVARIRPPDYPVHDSPTAATLRDGLDFLLDVDPGPQARTVAREFEALLDREERRMRRRYQLPEDLRDRGFGEEIDNPRYQDERRFAWIHRSQLGMEHPSFRNGIIGRLIELGLATDTRFDPLTGTRDDGQWVGMHPRLVATYSCALAARIAEANALTPVTDDPRLFVAPHYATVDEWGAELLEGVRPTPGPAGSPAASLYACVTLQAVLPDDISNVPAEDIVRARQALTDEFDAFRAHLEALGEEFASLGGIEDPRILRARVQAMVDRDLTGPMRELERGLRALRMAPIRSVFGLKSLELPAVAALSAHALSISPVVGASSMIAVQLLASTRTTRQAAITERTSAAGYLLCLRGELDPVGAGARARRALVRGVRRWSPW